MKRLVIFSRAFSSDEGNVAKGAYLAAFDGNNLRTVLDAAPERVLPLWIETP